MKDYLLFYEFVPDHAERRQPHRAAHLKLAWEAKERGELVLAGAWTDDGKVGATLHFRAESPEAVERFVESDPYYKAGLVTSWSVREWITVVGDAARLPTRPDDA